MLSAIAARVAGRSRLRGILTHPAPVQRRRCGIAEARADGEHARPPPVGDFAQGARPADTTRFDRQYFYWLDHHGQLFLHGTRIMNWVTCFKEPRFLDLFISRMRRNDTGHYTDAFPYTSPCGRELNFLAVEDRPIVFTRLTADTPAALEYAGSLRVPFAPERLVMSAHGRVYHPAPFGGLGLLRSALALEIGRSIRHTGDGAVLQWAGRDVAIEVSTETPAEWERRVARVEQQATDDAAARADRRRRSTAQQ